MQISNLDIAKFFDDIADILETQDANYYRTRAYRQAAQALRTTKLNIANHVKQGRDLTSIPSIGSHLAAKIKEIVETGHCKTWETLSCNEPFGLVDLLHIPGLGPKRIHALYHELGVHTPEQVLQASKEGRVKALDGFGEKTQTRIVNAIEQHLASK
jgi:DNA polymerase (family 10)